ncbi:MAG: class I SAM-dependent methyltransferase [Chloroflexota bacterium]
MSRRLFEEVSRVGFGERTVLEVGCGYGRTLAGALVGGARAVTGVELDPEAVVQAGERTARAGHRDRCTLVVGDAAIIPLAMHDIVILDRVICCYDDADGLVDRSVRAAGMVYAFSVPESRGLRGVWNRLAYGLEGAWDRLRGQPRSWLHDVERIHRRLAADGFTRAVWGREGKWYLAVYRRLQN